MRLSLGALLVLAGLLLVAWALAGTYLGSPGREGVGPVSGSGALEQEGAQRLVAPPVEAADEDSALPSAAPDERRGVDVDGALTATVALERGFAVRLDVVDAQGEPLVGASVVVDGEELGTTDAEGRYLLVRADTPSSVEVSLGERIASGDVLEALAAGKPVCELRLGDG